MKKQYNFFHKTFSNNKPLIETMRKFFHKLLSVRKLLCVWMIPIILLPIPLSIGTNVSSFK
jgi:hypothetical protein